MVEPVVPPSATGGGSAPGGAAAGRLRLLALAVVLALGLLAGAWLGARRGTPGPGGLAVPGPAQALLSVFGPPPAEEKLLFATTPQAPARVPDLLPAGVGLVYLFFEVPGVGQAGAPGVTWARGRETPVTVPAADVVAGSRPGSGTVALRAPSGGLSPGVYEVHLAFAEKRVSASFVAAWGAEAIAGQPAPRDAEALIGEAACAAALDRAGRPVRAVKAFGSCDRITFAFHFRQAEPGSAVEVRWYGGTTCLENATHEVVLPSTEGWGSAWLQAPFPGLPAGNYRAAVNMTGDRRELASAEFTITGPSTLPSPTSDRTRRRPGAPRPPDVR